jgi:hypothetical protein
MQTIAERHGILPNGWNTAYRTSSPDRLLYCWVILRNCRKGLASCFGRPYPETSDNLSCRVSSKLKKFYLIYMEKVGKMLAAK